jgi:hypothetical protein
MIIAPFPWLLTALAVALAAAVGVFALPGLSIPLALMVALALLVVPPALSRRVFGLIEDLGRATGKTRPAVSGGYVAETTTTRLGLVVSGATNVALCALGLLATALSSGALHVSL